jgi:hypothetical protein
MNSNAMQQKAWHETDFERCSEGIASSMSNRANPAK